MAEKNTLSILESIKRKMSKFDQKSKKPEVTFDMKDEFEYISVDKSGSVAQANAEAKPEVKAPEAPALVAPAPISPPAIEIPIPAKPLAPANELSFDDFNLDDEIEEKAPAPVAPPQAANKAADVVLEEEAEDDFEEDFDEEDFEDYEDEVEMEEEYDEEEPAAKAAKQDDLDIEEDDDSLSFYEDEEEKEEPKKEAVENKTAEDDFLDLDEDEPQEIKKPVEATLSPKIEDLDLDDDLNFEELDRKEETAKKAAADKVLAQKEEVEEDLEEDPEEIEEEHEELDEDIDLDHDEEVMRQKEHSNNVNINDVDMKDDKSSLNNQTLDFIDIDLDKEPEKFQPLQPPVPPVAKPVVQPIVQNSQMFESQAAGSISVMPSSERKSEESVSILSQETVQGASNSIRKLLDANNVISGVKNFSQDPVLSEIAVQLMEPKLEKWLNENLAEIVERIVKEEIKKIVPKL